jgi:hypothetical protein
MMRKPDSHIIRKTSISLTLAGKRDGLQLQQDLSEWCRDELGAALEKVLSAYDRTEEVIFIDQLTLDIDLGNTLDWKTGLAGEISHKLKDKIQQVKAAESVPASLKPSIAGFTEILCYFLKFGILPWNSYIKNDDEFRAEVHTWLSKISSSEINQILSISGDMDSARRLVNILGQTDFEVIISIIAIEPVQLISSYLKNIEVIINYITEDKRLNKSLLNSYKEKIFIHVPRSSPGSFFKNAFTAWLKEIDEKYPGSLKNVDLAAIHDKDMILIIGQHLLELPVSQVRKVEKSTGQAGPAKKKNKFADELKAELTEGVFISNAGAVIIAPFLPRLFSLTGIVKDDIILDKPAALALLRYCINGHSNAAEFDLLLPKILCGIQPEEYIDMPSQDSGTLMNEANEMLKSVIGHWSVLKDTSVDGLREAFLQRNGKLVYSEDEWLLIAEHKPYDMLLEQLPWNIGMIKLPWMKKMLKTQWN